MRAPIALLALAFAVLWPSIAAAEQPVATFSIVGRDPDTGDLGVIVQSKFFAVGAVVPWAKANVGAIATQAFANTTYGPEGLRLLANGLDAPSAGMQLTEGDPDAQSRQIGIVDANGHAACFTGSKCQPWAGHESGTNFAAQGNILVSEATVAAMAETFRTTPGPLGDKLMAALEAGQAAGGDSRGMQSAALLIVREGAGYGGFNDRYCDLRVDDHADPIGELRRLYTEWRWQALILEGYRHAEAGDVAAAAAAGEALMALRPDDGESYYHPACYASKAGRLEEALQLLETAVERTPGLGPRAATDPDFAPLTADERFRRLTESTSSER